MKEKLLNNLISLAIYEIFGIVGLLIAGLTVMQSIGYGLLFALVLGCLNEIRRDIWDFRKHIEEEQKKTSNEQLEVLKELRNKLSNYTMR